MVHTRQLSEPLRLYSWTVIPPAPDDPGSVGVTDVEQLALAHVGEALRAAPSGAHGLVHRVTSSLTRIGYDYDGLIARGSFDTSIGTVVWKYLPELTGDPGRAVERPVECRPCRGGDR